MDEIIERLKNTSENCQKIYEEWQVNKKDEAKREALQEAVHELRKVASRLEIEVATSERDQMASKPIPVPTHKSNQKGKKGGSNNQKSQNNGGDDNGDDSNGGDDQQPKVETVKKRRGRRPKKQENTQDGDNGNNNENSED